MIHMNEYGKEKERISTFTFTFIFMFTDRFGKVSMMEMQTEGGKQEMVAECSLMDVTQTEYVPVDLYRPSRT